MNKLFVYVVVVVFVLAPRSNGVPISCTPKEATVSQIGLLDFPQSGVSGNIDGDSFTDGKQQLTNTHV